MKIKDSPFKSVKALPGHRLEVHMSTNARIVFDFTSLLRTIRYGLLENEGFFNTVDTDGFAIVFGKEKREEIRISESEFIDMVMVDRTSDWSGLPDPGERARQCGAAGRHE
ncbi:MAG: hypothetical protein LBG12_09485 [Synergistaceae bacterium]|nr:hypothetical protein [Synergistaceae bacterium]